MSNEDLENLLEHDEYKTGNSNHPVSYDAVKDHLNQFGSHQIAISDAKSALMQAEYSSNDPTQSENHDYTQQNDPNEQLVKH